MKSLTRCANPFIVVAVLALSCVTLLLRGAAPTGEGMRAERDSTNGQVVITEGTRPVLRYNYQAVEPGDLLKQIKSNNLIYARARSDYIHPLYGPSGEALTKDWPVDHPHHRGIYWAWPEVDWNTQRGDLHALQKVFARPTGRIRLSQSADYAQIEAENDWRWEDGEPIVRELALIRAHRSSPSGRVIDLAFCFLALQDQVALARRGTDKYGGLNVRCEKPAGQEILLHTDPPERTPRRAWSDLSGVFQGGTGASGVAVIQHRQNPDYPGDWAKYPELSFFQPTFPAAKTRFALSRESPLVLRYRLWVHAGGTPDENAMASQWEAFNAPGALLPVPTLADKQIK